MAPCHCPVEHVAQDVVRPVGAARPLAAILVKPARDIGARHGIHAKGADNRQDGMPQVAHGRLARGWLPCGRASLHVLRREPRERRAGSGRRDGPPVGLVAREQRQRCGARLVGRRRPDLPEGDAARPAVAAKPEYPRPRPARLHPEDEPSQRLVMDRVLALARLRRERENVSQASALNHWPVPFRRVRRQECAIPCSPPRRLPPP